MEKAWVKAGRAVCRDGEGKVVVCSKHAKGNVFS
jgi:hypothetical protein